MAPLAVAALRCLAVLAAVGPATASPDEPMQANAAEVLEYEVKTLKDEKAALLGDKQALLKTVKHLLRNNQTLVLERSVQELTRSRTSLEERCAHERKQGEDEATRAEAAMATATASVGAAKKRVSAMRKLNVALAAKLRETQSQLEEATRKADALVYDKEHLLKTMQGLLRQNQEYAKNAAAEKSAKEKRKQEEAAAAQNLTRALRGYAHRHQRVASPSGPTPGSSKEHLGGNRIAKHEQALSTEEDVTAHADETKESSNDDPTAYMGETKEITAYIAKYKAEHRLDDAPPRGPSGRLDQWLSSDLGGGAEGPGPSESSEEDLGVGSLWR